MKSLFTACALAAAALVATPVFAQTYIGGGFGSSQVSNFDSAGVSGGNTSKGLVKVYGGYQFTPTWGVEAQYSDLGRRDLALSGLNGTTSFKLSQYSLAGTATLPLSSGFSLLGKAGFSTNRASANGSESKTSLLLGFGAAYAITPALSARVEYESFGKIATYTNNGTTISPGANGYSISLKYAF